MTNEAHDRKGRGNKIYAVLGMMRQINDADIAALNAAGLNSLSAACEIIGQRAENEMRRRHVDTLEDAHNATRDMFAATNPPKGWKKAI